MMFRHVSSLHAGELLVLGTLKEGRRGGANGDEYFEIV